MDNDELLTRSLLGAMAGIVAWLAWVFTGLASPSDSVIATTGLSIAATTGVLFICRALQGTTRVSDPHGLARAMAAFVGFGAVAVALYFGDAPGLLVRTASAASQMGCGLFLGFRKKAATGALGFAAVLSAIDTPFYGTVLLAVGLAAYLERNPPSFLR